MSAAWYLVQIKTFPVYQCACIIYHLKIYCIYYKLGLDNKWKTNPLQYELKKYELSCCIDFQDAKHIFFIHIERTVFLLYASLAITY